MKVQSMLEEKKNELMMWRKKNRKSTKRLVLEKIRRTSKKVVQGLLSAKGNQAHTNTPSGLKLFIVDAFKCQFVDTNCAFRAQFQTTRVKFRHPIPFGKRAIVSFGG